MRRALVFALGLFCVLLSLSVSSLAQGSKLAVDDDEEMGQIDAPAARENWFRKGRQSSDLLSAAEHLQRAFQQKLELRRQRSLRLQSKAQNSQLKASVATTVGDANTVWVPLGPAPIIPDKFASQDYGPVTGRATAVAVNPTDPTGNTVLLGGAFGGAWLSHNAAANDALSVTWQPVLDQQPSLAVGSVAWSSDGSIMLVGTGEGDSSWDSYYGMGFLRSTDGGATWAQIPMSQDAHSFRGLAIQRIAWSKSSPQTVAASTMFAARGNSSLYSNTVQGIYYSTDSGSTWNLAKAFEDAEGKQQTSVASSHSVAWNPADHRFYASLRYHGIYVSKPDDPSAFYRLAAQPDSVGSGTLNDASSCGVSGGSNCPMFRAEIATNPKRNEIYVWWIQYPATHRGIWKSTNSGASWTKLNDSGFTNCGDNSGCGASQSFYNMTLLAVPNASNNNWTDLFLGSVNLYKCTIDSNTPANAACGGSTEPFHFMNLTHVYGGGSCVPGAPAHVHPDHHGMAVAPNSSTVFFANDGGLSRTLNSAGLDTAACSAKQPFDNLNANMGSMTQFVWGTAIPNDAKGMLAGAQDNGTSMVFSGAATSGQEWIFTNGGDGGYSDIDPQNPTKNWFTSNHDVSIQSCTLGTSCNRSNWGSNIGTSQDLVINTDLAGDESSFYAPWMLDPQFSTRLLVGTCRVWRGPTTRTSAAKWGGMAISPMLTYSGTCTSNDPVVTAIAAGGPKAASGSKVIWATLDNGTVWRTLDAGVTPMPSWQNVTPPSAPLLPVSSIALDPQDATGNSVYVAYQGFGFAHLWQTSDAGATWKPVFLNSGLPDAPFNNVIVDPDDSSVLYLATDVGVYGCDKTTNTCSEIGPTPESGTTGYLPNVPVFRVQIQKVSNPSRKLLKVVTYGRGAWMADIGPTTVAAIAQDFSGPVLTPTTATIPAGDRAQFAIGIAPTGATFSSAVTFSCALPLASGMSCTFSPASITPGSSSAQVELAITTTGKSVTTAKNTNLGPLVAALSIPGAMLLLPRRRLRSGAKGLLCAGMAAILFGISCGGAGTTTRNSGVAVSSGTQPGTYQIVVTATSGSIQHSTRLTITVQ